MPTPRAGSMRPRITVRRQSNPKESTIEAWGLVDGQPTSKHYRLLIYDDVVVRESVTNPTMIETTTRALEQSYNLGADGGIMRAVGTRWHFNDSYRTLLERGTFAKRVYNGTVDNCGDIKRPVLMSAETMAKKRRDMGQYTFACQIMQNPKHDSTQGFKREWLQHWTPDKGRGLNKYILVDPANSKKADADYTVFWVVGLGPDENFYVLAVIRDRLNLTERTDRLFALHRTWKPLEVRYETYGLQADIAHMQTVMNDEKYRFKITPVGGKMAKDDRIKRLVPLFEANRIILPHSYHITTAEGESKDMIHEFVENEYMAFPVAIHDDMLDGLARIEEKQAVGGAALTLKWPAKKQGGITHVEVATPQDPGMGM
jgi:predicted phage terminase large subunit-like protein